MGTYAESPATFVPSTDFMGQYGNDNHFILCTRVRVARSRNHEAPTKRSKARNPIWLSLFRIIYVSLLIMVPAYLLAMQFEGQSLQQTILLQNIVLAQAVYMINCRELSKPSLNQGLLQNKALFLSLGILALLQGMVIFLPVGQQLIGTVSLTMTQQLLIGANVILLFLVVEIEKGIMNKLFRKKEKTAREYSR